MITHLLRDNIKNLQPYSSARHEFEGTASVYLDANENSFGSPLNTAYNRYPDPLQWELKQKISTIKGVPPEHLFLGNGSDEAIDLLFRAFCNPGIDNVLILPPTYGMYEVSANINAVELRKVVLTPDFQLDLDGIFDAIDEHTKIIFICSPNNPTGNSINRADIEFILNNFNGIVVIDEAYINYAKQKSFIQELTEYNRLVILQTLSKAWGLAALRIGMAFSSLPVIEVMNKIKPPYNINEATQQLALAALNNTTQVNDWIKTTVNEREKLASALQKMPFIQKVYPSDANFILVKMVDANPVYTYLLAAGIVVRNRSKITRCEECLRITIGTPEENKLLIDTLTQYQK